MRRYRWTGMLTMLLAMLIVYIPGGRTVVPRFIVPALSEEPMVFSVSVSAESTPVPESATIVPSPQPDEPVHAAFTVEVIRELDTAKLCAGKRVLIYHTHTWEAYEQSGEVYQETEKWRTKDNAHNVVAVGEALAAGLRVLGAEVVHDTTAFEPPDLESAYTRSLAMLEARCDAGERYDLYIDLHRDALSSSSTIRRTVTIHGEEAARFMVLVGQGTTGGYQEKPDWEKNLVYAQRITEALNAQCEGLARDVKIKTGRFNQHIADCCVLIECGVNTNTLDQVLTGIPYLVQAVAEALQ